MQSNKWFGLSQFVMVGQLGLSLLMPLLLCLFGCHLLTLRFNVGGWIYILGFFFGLGGSAMTAWKVYLSIMRHQGGSKPRKRKSEVSFNRHY